MESVKQLRWWILAALLLIGVVFSVLGVVGTNDWEGFLLNCGTELIGAVILYVLLELFLERREEREARKMDLIARMSSSEKSVAIPAFEEMRHESWLKDGSLRRADLSSANLPRVDLNNADLQGAYLQEAKLQNANLLYANLRGALLAAAEVSEANLSHADLRGANLSFANLQKADLFKANLEGALMYATKLQGADLERADLRGAYLETPRESEDLEGLPADAQAHLIGLSRARFDEETTLPDGTKWTPDTDIFRFTNPNHPEFWYPSKR